MPEIYLHSRMPGMRYMIVRGPWVSQLGTQLVMATALDDDGTQLVQQQVATKYLYTPDEIGHRSLITECVRCGYRFETTGKPHGLCQRCRKAMQERQQQQEEYERMLAEMELERLRIAREEEVRLSVEKRYATREPVKPVDRLLLRMQRNAAFLRKSMDEKIVASGDLSNDFYPVNEMEVIWLFSQIADLIGYHPKRLKSNMYPDGIFIDDAGGQILIEFEHMSGNFLAHGHKPELADMVVCWRKDKDLPIPILALASLYDIPSRTWRFDQLDPVAILSSPQEAFQDVPG